DWIRKYEAQTDAEALLPYENDLESANNGIL
ncbi:hypothetical protein M514_13997, partial [Trichuris suis]